MGIKFNFKCPYCGHENSTFKKDVHNYSSLTLYSCDGETGGCDQPFVLETKVVPYAFVRCIDGYEKFDPISIDPYDIADLDS